jgi:hypothetical protein
MTSMLTLARRAATAVLTAALTLGVVAAVPSTAHAAPATEAASVSASSAAKVRSNVTVNLYKVRRHVALQVGSPFWGTPKTPTGVVKVSIARRTGKVVIRKTVEVRGGRASFFYRKVRAGRYTITAYYPGDRNHLADTGRKSFRVN